MILFFILMLCNSEILCNFAAKISIWFLKTDRMGKQTSIALFFFLLFLSLNSMAQSVEITQPFRLHDMASVLTIYKNQFGEYENRLVDDSFPYAVIRVELEGTGSEVKQAKDQLGLDLGYMYKVKEVYKDNNNEILFLVPANIRNVYIECGDGCDPLPIFDGTQPLQSNTVYFGKVHYIPEQVVPVVPVEKMQSSLSAPAEVEEDVIFITVERMPEYPGGQSAMMQYIGSSVRYPNEALKNGVQGRVIVQFVVEKDGSISDVVIVRSSGDASLDREAIRVISNMPRWKPGMQRGKPVRVKYTVPVNFRLN